MPMPFKETPATLIKGGVTVTVNPQREVFQDGTVVVDGDTIVDVGDTGHVMTRMDPSIAEGAHVIDAKGHIVIPGLVSCHTHLFQCLFRGLADDMIVEDWVREMILPMSEHMGEEECYAAGRLAMAEMLLSGTTTFADSHYIHVDKRAMDGLAQAVIDCGLRGLLARATQDTNMPGAFLEDPAIAARESERLISRYNRPGGPVRICPEALSVYECTDDLIQRLSALGREAETGFHMHVSESYIEFTDLRKRMGRGVVEYLDMLGVLGPDRLFAHCVWITENEIRRLAETDTKVAHNPVSNLFLADGIAPVPRMLSHGITMGIGVDGASSNNSQDLFEAMKICALSHKVNTMDPTVLTPERVLELATIDSARALRWDDEVGSLEPGKKADLILVNTRSASLSPQLRPVSNLVFASAGRNVRLVMVGGEVLVRDGQLVAVSESQIVADANRVASGLVKRAGLDNLVRRNAWPVV